MPKVIGIIPSRYGSKRFPGKALALIAGVPLVVRVLQNALQSHSLSEVMVACDDDRIVEAVARFGGRAVITGSGHLTGSDRVAEAARRLDCELVVNIQGDEPLLPPEAIDRVVGLLGDPGVVMSTACSPLDPALGNDPNIVKVVMDQCGDAIYFSRSRIPFARSGDAAPARLYRHIGIYGFRREFLFAFAALPRTPLETAESLEQLRALEHGHKIRVAMVDSDFVAVDTASDLAKAEEIFKIRDIKNAKS